MGLAEHKADSVAQKVVPEVDRFSPEEHKALLAERGVDLDDRRVVPIGPKVVPVNGRVVLVGHRVVPVSM